MPPRNYGASPQVLLPIVSMLYCHCQQTRKPFNHPSRQEKPAGQGEEQGAGVETVVLGLISRPLTKSSHTGGAGGHPSVAKTIFQLRCQGERTRGPGVTTEDQLHMKSTAQQQSYQIMMRFFGLREEAGAPGENPQTGMQTKSLPAKRRQRRLLNQQIDFSRFRPRLPLQPSPSLTNYLPPCWLLLSDMRAADGRPV
ncbi:unnamed protein product [Pleuronectes platessa]|uniref:Uncharacterized protein n=1 Tax=Pleuronectes platessa TaxID=8262 RepID=A0A9N7TSZ2_PLEPL|nr:unnamed protein product [Pleuronectes platessa]